MFCLYKLKNADISHGTMLSQERLKEQIKTKKKKQKNKEKKYTEGDTQGLV